MKFEIGEGASVKLDALLSTRLMVQANSGAGKSYFLRRLLEQTHGRVQQFVIDPEGEFATLRQRFDYVLAAKNGGDTLAEPRAAKLLAERLLQLRVSAILDIQELKPTERIEFVQVFLESLIDAPKSLWHPALIAIDEAHVFCPQAGDAASSIAVRDLCARGRKRGYCAVLASQRISKLHKDAVAECQNKMIGRASLDVDIKRCADELGFTRDRWQEFRRLKPGEFFAYGPAIEAHPVPGAKKVAQLVTRVRVGAVITQHPKVGNRRLRAKTLPPPTRKIKKLLPKLSDLPAEAEQQMTTAKQLRAKVVELTNELRDAKNAAPKDVIKTKRVEVPVLKPRVVRALVKDLKRIAPIIGVMRKFEPRIGALERSVTACTVALADRDSIVAASPQADVLRASTARREYPGGFVAVANNGKATIGKAADGLSTPERRLLDAMAWFESIGVREPEQPAVSFMAGYTYGSGAFNGPRGTLKKKGLVEYHHGNRIALTANGRASANYPPRHETATVQQLHKSVLSRLPGPEQRLLSPLLEVWPKVMDQRELAEKSNYSFNSGAFNNPRGRLRTLGLIEIPAPGKIVARDLLFPNLRR